MANRISRPWLGRAGVELLIIVMGVLIAFQVDGWREENDARQREAWHLEALQLDLLENRRRLREVMGYGEGVVAAHRELLRIRNGDVDRPDSDSLIYLVSHSVEFQRLEAVTGAYDALVGSGDLGLISDQRLRTQLASFAGDLGDGFEDDELGSLVRADCFGAVSRATDFLAILRPELRSLARLPESSVRPDFDALLESREYMGCVATLSVLEASQVRYFGDLLSRVDAILDLLN